MTAGLQVFNDNGSIQFTTETFSMVLHSKGTVTTIAPIPVQVVLPPYQYIGDKCTSRATFSSTSLPPNGVFAFACTEKISAKDGGTPVSASAAGGASGFNLACNGAIGTTIEWWYFCPSNNMPASGSNTGIQVFSSTGEVCYDSAYKPLRVVDFKARIQGSGTTWSQGDIGSFTYTAGRKYAMIPCAPGGIRLSTDRGGGRKDGDNMNVLGSISGNVVTIASQIGSIAGTYITSLNSGTWYYGNWAVLIADVTDL